MSIGLRMPANFDNFTHREEVLGRKEWIIGLGNSNARLFTQLFQYMFTDVTVLGPDDDPALMPIDALVEPSIEAFEFSVPEQTNTEAFSVWIRYRIKVFDRNGTQTAAWPVSAYGKSQTTTLGGDEALQRAAVLAMRDAVALMIMKFDAETGISSLANTPAAAAPGPAPENDAEAAQTAVAEEIPDETS